jgi:hypothetical protein
MRRLLVAAIATALGACAAAQTIARAADAAISRAEANKAKQEMVKST